MNLGAYIVMMSAACTFIALTKQKRTLALIIIPVVLVVFISNTFSGIKVLRARALLHTSIHINGNE